MKKIICSIIASMFILSSCNKNLIPINRNKLSKTVLYCFEEKDSSGLEKLFCDEIKESHDLDIEIQNVFQYMEGNVVSYKIESGIEQESIENGSAVKREINMLIKHIKTDSGKEYIISFVYREVDIENPSKVGITKLSVGTYYNGSVSKKSKEYVGELV